MKTFDEWYDAQPMIIMDRRTEHHLTWNASAENAQAEIARRDAELAELKLAYSESSRQKQDLIVHRRNDVKQIAYLAAQNQQLRDLLNHFKDDVLFRIGINSPYRTDVVAPYYERVKAALTLPDLASPYLNRVKAEALREAAEEFDRKARVINAVGGCSTLAAVELRRMADAIEKGD